MAEGEAHTSGPFWGGDPGLYQDEKFDAAAEAEFFHSFFAPFREPQRLWECLRHLLRLGNSSGFVGFFSSSADFCLPPPRAAVC